MTLITFIKPAVQCEWAIDDLEGSLLASAVGVGTLLGSLVLGVVADAFGRRVGFTLTVGILFVFGLVSAVSPGYEWLLMARFFCGVGLGGVPVVFSLTMEFVPTAVRGRWGIGFLFFWSVGALFEAALAWAVIIPLGWRWQVGLTAVPAGIVLLLSPMVPESPRWLIAQGRFEEAQGVLSRMGVVSGEVLAGKLRVDERSTVPGIDDALADESELIDGDKSTRKGCTAVAACDRVGQLLVPGLRQITVLLWFIWLAGGSINCTSYLLRLPAVSALHLYIVKLALILRLNTR
jgi:MFS family permease